MGRQLVEKIEKALEKIQWPELQAATEQGRRIYVQAMEQVDDYKGDPKALMGAIRLLRTADSQPYCFAGIAYVLIAASKENDGTYNQHGLDTAMAWLEKAQEMEPEIVAINVIEAIIYVHSGRMDDARLILDYLTNIEPLSYQLHLAEVVYWTTAKDTEKSIEWIEAASDAAITVPQRLRMRSRLGDVYLIAKDYDKAIEVIREALHFDNGNASLWHRLSIAYYRVGNLEESENANRRVLSIQPKHGAALKLNAALKKAKGQTGGLRRLLGGS